MRPTYECLALVAPEQPDAEDRIQSGQLASDAVQAVILGEMLRARDLLSRATELDPTSAELAYRHARVLEDLAANEDALLEYCRALDLGAGDAGIADAPARIDAIYQVVRERIPTAARAAFAYGVSTADAGSFAESAESFSAAIAEVPDWGVAIYNRAVVFEAMGLVGESLADYRRYLEVTPNDIDPVVARASERIGMLEGMLTAPTPNPGGTLALGFAFPGMGHYYSGRSLTGTLVLGAAGAAVATGLMVKEVTVRCLSPTPGGDDCAPADVLGESSRRPYLIPALSAAGAVTLVAAIEAYARARRRRAEAEQETESPAPQGLELAGPAVSNRGDRIDVRVLGLRFR